MGVENNVENLKTRPTFQQKNVETSVLERMNRKIWLCIVTFHCQTVETSVEKLKSGKFAKSYQDILFSGRIY